MNCNTLRPPGRSESLLKALSAPDCTVCLSMSCRLPGQYSDSCLSYLSISAIFSSQVLVPIKKQNTNSEKQIKEIQILSQICTETSCPEGIQVSSCKTRILPKHLPRALLLGHVETYKLFQTVQQRETGQPQAVPNSVDHNSTEGTSNVSGF